ncbi:MAG: ABC transporter transmembrane domain-containing protein, partial [Planctomycetota bacterium]|nr:ABC transporter transmembrane domain-containing protein [Planctomycetota bacterium]
NRLGLAELSPQERTEGDAPKDTDDVAKEEAAEQLRDYSKSWIGQKIEGVIQTLNAVTSSWVPDTWIEEHAATVPESERRYATLFSTLILFGLITLLMCVATYADTYLSQLVQLRVGMDVREEVCRKVLDQPMTFFDEGKRGDIFQRALNDSSGYARGLAMILGTLRSVQQVGSSFVVLLVLSPMLSLVTILGLPFLLPMKKLSMKTLKRSHKRQKKATDLVETLHQNLSGVRTVKAFGLEERRVEDFRATDESLTSSALKVQRAKSTSMALVAFINNFLAVALVLGGGWFIMR